MNKPCYEVREFHNFRELLNQSEKLYGNSPAFKIKNQIGQILDISYTRYKADVEALGTALLSLGLGGAKIAVAGMNSYKWCTSYLAIGCGVGVVVPTDKELPFDDILSILSVSEAKAIIFDEKFGEKLLEHREKLPKNLLLISMEQQKGAEGKRRVIPDGRFPELRVLLVDALRRDRHSQNDVCFGFTRMERGIEQAPFDCTVIEYRMHIAGIMLSST